MTKRTSLLIAGALMFLTASCGGEDPLIQAMADDMASRADGLSTDPAETLCISQTSYEILGSDRLNELGITEENPNLLSAVVTESEAEELVDGLYSCVDVDAMVETQIADAGLPAEAAACIIESLGQDGIRQLILEQFQGEDLALTPEAQTAMLACLAADG